MTRFARRSIRALLIAALLLLGAGEARTVAIGGIATSPRIETKTLPSGREGLPVWFLPRLGVQTVNRPDEIRLAYAGRELRFAQGGWNVAGLPLPEVHAGSVHVLLDVIRALGVPVLIDDPDVLDYAAPTAGQGGAAPAVGQGGAAPATTPGAGAQTGQGLPASPLPPGTTTATGTAGTVLEGAAASAAQLGEVRSSRAVNRATETQRIVLQFTGPVRYVVLQDRQGVTITVPDVTVAGTVPGGVQALDSGDSLTVTPLASALTVRLDTGDDGSSRVFALDDPPRIVVDTVTQLDPNVTPPPDLEKLPQGAAHRRVGKLQILTFDPALYVPRIVTAPAGSSSSVYDFVQRAGGVAGVNGGYFDPRSALPVDLVARGGLMLAPSLERRGAVGFTDAGAILFGTPRPRYTLSGTWGSVTVNSVRAQPHPQWLTLFVGDGRTRVGGAGFTTLATDGHSVLRVHSDAAVPREGEIAVTFDAARFPQLPRSAGETLRVNLNWAAPGWEGVREALAAGPLLVDGGRVVIDPQREGFDTASNVWRPTRQVAFVLDGAKLESARPGIAYFDSGTPEEFARALAAAGVQRALRLDSGSSATVYVSGGYFNTVWSRAVPNAIVIVPRVPVAQR